MRKYVQQQWGGQCVVGRVQQDAIALLTIEEAKGLEFDAVLLMDNQLNYNELYIGYTRALDNLLVASFDSSDACMVDMPSDEQDEFAWAVRDISLFEEDNLAIPAPITDFFGSDVALAQLFATLSAAV